MRDKKYEAFLKTITTESEVYAIFGRGLPHLFYKVYVRATPRGRWWRIKQSARPVAYCPRKEAKSYPLKGRLGAFDGPVGYVLLYEHINYEAICQLRARLVEVCGEAKHHLQLAEGPPKVPVRP